VSVDLHLHTTASDGRCTPRELVERASAAGVTVMAVTDHDTLAAVRDAQAIGRDRDIIVIAGIEITALEDGRDVHGTSWTSTTGISMPFCGSSARIASNVCVR
jgi:predicted metal-dependent phosphoesterase TrpH